MLLKPCPFCQKEIPRSMTACPYCHRDEKGGIVPMDTAAAPEDRHAIDNNLREMASDDPVVRDQAVVRMAQRGAAVVPELIGVLSDHTRPGLPAVAKALGRLADRRAIPALTHAARLGDDDLRMAAVWALSQFRESEILPVLLAEAERPHPDIQAFLAFRLGGFHDAKVLPVLARLARHPSREVAFQAACALAETGDPLAVKPLRKALRRRDAVVRAAALAALRRYGASALEPVRTLVYIAAALLAAVCAAGAWWYFQR